MTETVRVYQVARPVDNASAIFVTDQNNLILPPVPQVSRMAISSGTLKEGIYVIHRAGGPPMDIRPQSHPFETGALVYPTPTNRDWTRMGSSDYDTFRVVSVHNVPQDVFARKMEEHTKKIQTVDDERQRIWETYKKRIKELEEFRDEELKAIDTPRLSLDKLLKQQPQR